MPPSETPDVVNWRCHLKAKYVFGFTGVSESGTERRMIFAFESEVSPMSSPFGSPRFESAEDLHNRHVWGDSVETIFKSFVKSGRFWRKCD